MDSRGDTALRDQLLGNFTEANHLIDLGRSEMHPIYRRDEFDNRVNLWIPTFDGDSDQS